LRKNACHTVAVLKIVWNFKKIVVNDTSLQSGRTNRKIQTEAMKLVYPPHHSSPHQTWVTKKMEKLPPFCSGSDNLSLYRSQTPLALDA